MEYLKKELNKILPLALLFGAIGGILLIILCNVFVATYFNIVLTYALSIGVSVYLLNKLRYRHELKSSILYGYCVFVVMTLLAFFDMLMNTKSNFVNPIFENVVFFFGIMALVVIFSSMITYLFQRKLIR